MSIFYKKGSDEGHDAEKLNTLLEILLNNRIIQDGTLASDSNQAKVIFFSLSNNQSIYFVKL